MKDEIFVERKFAPVTVGIAGAKENSFAPLNRVRQKFFAMNRFLVTNANHACGSDCGIDRHRIDRAEFAHKMQRRVHVRARVRAHGGPRHGADISRCSDPSHGQNEDGIAGPEGMPSCTGTEISIHEFFTRNAPWSHSAILSEKVTRHTRVLANSSSSRLKASRSMTHCHPGQRFT